MILESTAFGKKKEPTNVEDLRLFRKELEERKGKYYFNPLIPQLPVYRNKNLKFKEFQVNLYNLSCTCPDFYDKQLKKYEQYDVRNVCIHLYYRLRNLVNKEVDNLTFQFIESAVKYNSEYFYTFHFEPDRKTVYYSFSKKSDWVNVFAKPNVVGSPYYVRFGYNPVKKRWSYNTAPEPAWKIEHILDSIIKYQLPYQHNALK